MFYGMMAWFFWRKNHELLSRLVAGLMVVLTLQCVKDLFFIMPEVDTDSYTWMIMTSTDTIAVPLYAFLLIELCRPGVLTWKMMAAHELPFVLLPLLFCITHSRFFYYADVIWAAVYGLGAACWAITAIPIYHKLLKERFSYEENINLNWLRYILLSFFAVLSLWAVDCVIINFDIEALYMCGSIIIWMQICYLIYRHESVINELSEPIIVEEPSTPAEDIISGLKESILNLFEKEHIYLNPKLSLSDVAAMAKSNRTYVSRFFNDYNGMTFFEFVNQYRVKHAMTLLKTSDEKLDIIAELSGFSSRQSFHRVFSKMAGCTPEQFRTPPRRKTLITSTFYELLLRFMRIATPHRRILYAL